MKTNRKLNVRGRWIHAALTAAAPALRLDSVDIGPFALALQEVDTTIYRMQFPALIGTQLVPVKPVDPGVLTYGYRALTAVGRMKPIANFADDLPKVGASANGDQQRMVSWGESYSYSIQDLRYAARMGIPLDDEQARIAREAAARELDLTIFVGNTDVGVTGFTNAAGVPIIAAAAAWSTLTAAQVLAELQRLEFAVYNATNGVEIPDTLVLPSNVAQVLSQPLGTDANKTVLDFFLKTSTYIKQVEFSFRLNTAGVGGVGRAVCYRRDPSVLSALVAVEFEALPPQPRNLAFEVPCHMRCGGVIVRRPKAMVYMDGVSA